jgi:hypothetical protein
MTTSNSKKIGRPLGSKNKKPATRNVKTFKQSADHKILLTSLIGKLVEKVKSLEHQAVQYQAVISYLENKLEKK